MVPPQILCNKHLGGEHVECHMFVGAINKGKSIAGHSIMNQAEPKALVQRHDELAAEMLNRGMKHESPLIEPNLAMLPRGVLLTKINRKSALQDLLNRCPNCTLRYKEYNNEKD